MMCETDKVKQAVEALASIMRMIQRLGYDPEKVTLDEALRQIEKELFDGH
jgi:hypothetical protein